MRPDAGVEGQAQLGRRSCCCRAARRRSAGHPGGQGDVQLAAGGHVEQHALLVGQAGHGQAQERLGRVDGAVGAERGDRLAAAGPQVGLVVDEQRRAVLGGQRRAGRHPPIAQPPVGPPPRRCRAAAAAAPAPSVVAIGPVTAHIRSGASMPSRPRPRASDAGREVAQGQPAGAQPASSARQHRAGLVERGERLGQVEQVGAQPVRAVALERVGDAPSGSPAG